MSTAPHLRRLLFETLYKNRYLYRFASTVPFAGQWRVWQRLVMTRIHGHDILELGCGLGDLLADMLEAGYTCRAIEHSPQMVAAARTTLRKRNAGLESWVMQGSAQQLPFSDNMFDTIISTFPNEYIFDPATIAEVKRVLRPGGRIIIVEAGTLLSVGYLQPLLLLIHFLVYGSTGKSSHRHNQASENIFTAEESPATVFGKLIPLEQFDLRRSSERVCSQRWEVYITTGEKPE